MLSSRKIKIKKTKEKRTTSFLKILGDKYKHFRRHLENRLHFDFSGLATNFFTIEQKI
jgi:hypothetical protein